MATYTLISSNVLSSSAASVTFSAIPATYTDLVLRISARSDNADYNENMLITINSTSANYSTTYLRAIGSTASSGRNSSTSSLNPVYVDANTATSNTFSSTEVYIPSYIVSQSKPISGFTTVENNSATSNIISATASLWGNSAAITTLNFAPVYGTNWLSTSSFYLYGISNA